MSQRIPIKAAKDIADRYGYDQVIILASNDKVSWYTSYGKTKEFCRLASEELNNIYKWLEINAPKAYIYILHGNVENEE